MFVVHVSFESALLVGTVRAKITEKRPLFAALEVGVPFQIGPVRISFAAL